MLCRSLYHRNTQFQHLLYCRQAGAVIAGHLFQIILGHSLNDFLSTLAQGAERRNMQAAVNPIHIVSAGNFILRKFRHGQYILVATTGFMAVPLQCYECFVKDKKGGFMVMSIISKYRVRDLLSSIVLHRSCFQLIAGEQTEKFLSSIMIHVR